MIFPPKSLAEENPKQAGLKGAERGLGGGKRWSENAFMAAKLLLLTKP